MAIYVKSVFQEEGMQKLLGIKFYSLAEEWEKTWLQSLLDSIMGY